MDVFGIYALKKPINLIEILKRDIEGLGHQKALTLFVPVVTDLLHAVFLRLGFVVDLFLEVFADFDGVVDLVWKITISIYVFTIQNHNYNV